MYPIKSLFHRGLLPMLGGALLSACASAPDQQTASCPASANLLLDPTFSGLEEPVWRGRQHRRGKDFTVGVNDGRVTIEKIGQEPWFVFSQRLETNIPTGSELQFDAQLTLNTHPPEHSHGFGYVSGLYLMGQNGRIPAFRTMGEHTPNLGEHPEQAVVMRVITERPVTKIEAGFVHQAGGAFSARAPRLVNLTDYPGCRLP